MTRVELIDVKTGTVDWTGPIDDFIAANEDSPLSEEEVEHLAAHGYVVVGGGAVPPVCIRYALAEA